MFRSFFRKTGRLAWRIASTLLMAGLSGVGGGFGKLHEIEEPAPSDQIVFVVEIDDDYTRA